MKLFQAFKTYTSMIGINEQAKGQNIFNYKNVSIYSSIYFISVTAFLLFDASAIRKLVITFERINRF